MPPKKQNFLGIIEGNQGIIKSLCSAYYQSNEDRKDAFQDVVLQLWKSFDTFRGQSEISTWIYRVSLNTLLTKVRKEKTRVAMDHLDSAQLPPVVTGVDGDIELLHIVIQSLKPADRAIVILYLEGYKNKEISHILNLTATNISTRLTRIRAELRAKLKSQHYEFK